MYFDFPVRCLGTQKVKGCQCFPQHPEDRGSVLVVMSVFSVQCASPFSDCLAFLRYILWNTHWAWLESGQWRSEGLWLFRQADSWIWEMWGFLPFRCHLLVPSPTERTIRSYWWALNATGSKTYDRCCVREQALRNELSSFMASSSGLAQ